MSGQHDHEAVTPEISRQDAAEQPIDGSDHKEDSSRVAELILQHKAAQHEITVLRERVAQLENSLQLVNAVSKYDEHGDWQRAEARRRGETAPGNKSGNVDGAEGKPRRSAVRRPVGALKHITETTYPTMVRAQSVCSSRDDEACQVLTSFMVENRELSKTVEFLHTGVESITEEYEKASGDWKAKQLAFETSAAELKREREQLRTRVSDDVLRTRQIATLESTQSMQKTKRKLIDFTLRRMEACERTAMAAHDDMYYVRRFDGPIGPAKDVTVLYVDLLGLPAIGRELPHYHDDVIDIFEDIAFELLEQTGVFVYKEQTEVAWVLIFESALVAFNFAIKLQHRLLHAPWPEAVLHCKAFAATTDKSGNAIFKGARVRCGMETGNPAVDVNQRTLAIDYSGPVMHRAAMLTSAARVGETLVGDEAWRRIILEREAAVAPNVDEAFSVEEVQVATKDGRATVETNVSHHPSGAGAAWGHGLLSSSNPAAAPSALSGGQNSHRSSFVRDGDTIRMGKSQQPSAPGRNLDNESIAPSDQRSVGVASLEASATNITASRWAAVSVVAKELIARRKLWSNVKGKHPPKELEEERAKKQFVFKAENYGATTGSPVVQQIVGAGASTHSLAPQLSGSISNRQSSSTATPGDLSRKGTSNNSLHTVPSVTQLGNKHAVDATPNSSVRMGRMGSMRGVRRIVTSVTTPDQGSPPQSPRTKVLSLAVRRNFNMALKACEQFEQEMMQQHDEYTRYVTRVPLAREGDGVVICFVAVSNYQEIKRSLPRAVFSKALTTFLEVFHATCRAHSGTAAQHAPGAMLVAFSELYLAIEFCLSLQAKLLEVEWSTELRLNERCSDLIDPVTQKKFFNGLRAACGVEVVKNVEVVGNPDSSSARQSIGNVAYVGPGVLHWLLTLNHAARGGDITLGENAYWKIRHRGILKSFQDAVFTTRPSIRVRGVPKPQEIISLVTASVNKLRQEHWEREAANCHAQDVGARGGKCRRSREWFPIQLAAHPSEATKHGGGPRSSNAGVTSQPAQSGAATTHIVEEVLPALERSLMKRYDDSGIVDVPCVGPSTTIAFVDLDGDMSAIEAAAPDAIKLYHDVVRHSMEVFEGYGIRIDGLRYAIALSDPRTAFDFAFNIQARLLTDSAEGTVRNIRALDTMPDTLCVKARTRPDDSSSVRVVFRGPRAKIGLAVGTCRLTHLAATRRADYAGAPVDNASMLCEAAYGGEVLITQQLALEAERQPVGHGWVVVEPAGTVRCKSSRIAAFGAATATLHSRLILLSNRRHSERRKEKIVAIDDVEWYRRAPQLSGEQIERQKRGLAGFTASPVTPTAVTPEVQEARTAIDSMLRHVVERSKSIVDCREDYGQDETGKELKRVVDFIGLVVQVLLPRPDSSATEIDCSTIADLEEHFKESLKPLPSAASRQRQLDVTTAAGALFRAHIRLPEHTTAAERAQLKMVHPHEAVFNEETAAAAAAKSAPMRTKFTANRTDVKALLKYYSMATNNDAGNFLHYTQVPQLLRLANITHVDCSAIGSAGKIFYEMLDVLGLVYPETPIEDLQHLLNLVSGPQNILHPRPPGGIQTGPLGRSKATARKPETTTQCLQSSMRERTPPPGSSPSQSLSLSLKSLDSTAEMPFGGIDLHRVPVEAEKSVGPDNGGANLKQRDKRRPAGGTGTAQRFAQRGVTVNSPSKPPDGQPTSSPNTEPIRKKVVMGKAKSFRDHGKLQVHLPKDE